MRAKITNNSKAPQGVHTESGLTWLRRGQTRTLHPTEDGLKRAKRLSFLEVEELDDDRHDLKPGEPMKNAPDVPLPPAGDGPYEQGISAFDPELADAMTDDELRAYITQRDGKAPHHKAGHDKLVALAKGEPEA